MTTEEIKLRHEGLVYFDGELNPIGEIDFGVVSGNPELLSQFIADMVFVNKMNTIGRNKAWVLGHEYSPFKAQMFKQRLLSPSTIPNEFGEVKGWGSKFESEEEWNTFEKYYDEIFVTEKVEDEIQ